MAARSVQATVEGQNLDGQVLGASVLVEAAAIVFAALGLWDQTVGNAVMPPPTASPQPSLRGG